MKELPKIVRQRLQAKEQAGVHPDADLLTAFAEKSLPERERSLLMQHLAECADCREVVVLAMPEIEPAVMPIPRSSAWMSWPALRWGALAACVVVVGAAVTLQHERRQASEQSPAKEVAAPSVANSGEGNLSALPDEKMAANKLPPQPYPDQDAVRKLTKERDQSNEAATARQTTASGSAMSAPLPAPKAAEPARGELQAQNGPAEYAAKAGAQARTAESASASAAAPTAADKIEPQKKIQATQTESRAAIPLEGRDVNAVSAMSAAAASDAKDKPARAGAIRWTLSPDGFVQRSLDSGSTWETVPVAAGVAFRALAANGADIWAGGAAGALYHSADAGQHWIQIRPVVDGTPLTADVVALDFSDAQHGKLTTANHQTWFTSDAGISWRH